MGISKKLPTKLLVPQEVIESKILLVRGKKVMLDKDLAKLYGVSTKRLNEQVRRNIKRFPDDFILQLTQKEVINLRSQIATSSWGGRRYSPFAFTEQGVAMLSTVLNSERAIHVNIAIMRTFVKLRGMVSVSKKFMEKLASLEQRMELKDKEIRFIFEAIRQLITGPESVPEKPKKKIGFHK